MKRLARKGWRKVALSASLAVVPLLAVTAATDAPVDDVHIWTAGQHLAQARSLAARSGYQFTFDLQCRPSSTPPSSLFGPGAPPATKLFDNFYYVGMNSVGAYVIKTSEGLILIDGLNSEQDARQHLVPGMQALGLDPAEIKYVIVTHGHGDHYGGVKYIQDTYKPRVIASAADWGLMNRPFKPRPGDNRPPPNWGPPPARDMIGTDGQQLTLGDTTVTMVLTPGHTQGTLSLVIPVTDRGKSHALAMWGGTAIPDDPEILRQYVSSFAHFETFTKPAGVDVIMSNHPFVDGSLFKMEALRANPDGPNPFIVGAARYEDYTGILRHCAQAKGASQTPEVDIRGG